MNAFAPAKINLFLHVGPPGADGYHPLSSWMSFADIGDRLDFAPADGRVMVVEGAFAHELADTPAQRNLVMRAAEALLARAGSQAGFRLTLHKALPVASGLGGGSADAGAALRLLRHALGLPVGDAVLEEVAGEIGADGPACLWSRPVLAEGRGERLSPAPAAPVLDAVLVNPGVACATGAVYGAFDAALAQGGQGGAERPSLPERFDTAEAVVEALRGLRNDLEAPAVKLVPEIGLVLSRLRAERDALLARVSGSGASCFALCADEDAAERLAAVLVASEPSWWVRTCRIGGPAPE